MLGKGKPAGGGAGRALPAAERLRERLGCDWVATGHTRTDFAETMLYRLASSPGTRALLGLPPRRDRVVRPLLAIGRADTRRLAAAAALPFGDDPTIPTSRFARNRIRAEVLPAMRDVNNEAERNIAETRAELAEEARLLDRVVAQALDAAGPGTRRSRSAPTRSRAPSRPCAGSPCGRSPSEPRATRSRRPPAGRRDLAPRATPRGRRGGPGRRRPRAVRAGFDPVRGRRRGVARAGGAHRPGGSGFGAGDPGRAATVAPRGKRPGAGDPRSRCGRQRRRRPRVRAGDRIQPLEWRDPRRSRTCSPIARSRDRCDTRFRSISDDCGGWRAWPSPRSSGSAACPGRRWS